MNAHNHSSSHRVGDMLAGQPSHCYRPKHSRWNTTDQSVRMVDAQEKGEQEQEQEQQLLLNEESQEEQANQEDHQNPAKQIPDEDSDGCGTDPEEFDEVMNIIRSTAQNNGFDERHFFEQLFGTRKEVECPICLGIIKKTRTVMGCLHRFCRECIDKSMRLGNNECPACRIHCSSRRSLRDDPDFDALIHALYPDMVTYEEQELVLQEEEKTRNEQIQGSIAEISRLQSEALNKRCRVDRDTDDIKVPRYSRNTNSRRKNNRRTDMEVDNGNERENDVEGNLDPSPSDISQTQVRNRTARSIGAHRLRISTAANLDGEKSESPTDPLREEELNPTGAVHNPEIFTWGGGASRSHRGS